MLTEHKNSRTVVGATERDNNSYGIIKNTLILAQKQDKIKSRLDLYLQALDVLHHASRPAGGFPACLLRHTTPAARRVHLRQMGFRAVYDSGSVLVLEGGILVDLDSGYLHRTEGKRYGYDSRENGDRGEVWRGCGDLCP